MNNEPITDNRKVPVNVGDHVALAVPGCGTAYIAIAKITDIMYNTKSGKPRKEPGIRMEYGQTFIRDTTITATSFGNRCIKIGDHTFA